MKTCVTTIGDSDFLDETKRRQALAALLDELEAVGALAAKLRPDEEPADVEEVFAKLVAHPLATSPAAHPATRRVWGRLVMASRRHARLLALYTEPPGAPLAPGVRPGAVTLAALLVAMFAARRLLLPTPVVWWPAVLADDSAAIGRPLPQPAVPPPPAEIAEIEPATASPSL